MNNNSEHIQTENDDIKKKLEIVKKEHAFYITGKIFSRPYNWGGIHLIPETLGFTPEPDTPYSEYWIGVHHKAPGQLILPNETTIALEDVIKDDPEYVLGKDVSQKFHDLPFLFKLLDAEEMLSIQVHPTQEQAGKGFEEENKKGIPITDPKRTYKDNNQKFEFCVALGDFWLLNSFRPKDDLINVLQEYKEFSFLLPYFEDGNYKKLYTHVMVTMSDDEINKVLDTLAMRILPLYEDNKLDKDLPDFWAAKAMKYMNMQKGSYDRGIFSIYFLNLIHLKKGQAATQGSGVLHAYLYGPIIEVMTTSDNVVRGGITTKYIDIDALIKLVNFEGKKPTIIEGKNDVGEIFFDSFNDVYIVSKIHLKENKPYKTTSYSAEILMGLEGNAELTVESKTLSLAKGKSIIVFANTEYEIRGQDTDIIYKTSVPRH